MQLLKQGRAHASVLASTDPDQGVLDQQSAERCEFGSAAGLCTVYLGRVSATASGTGSSDIVVSGQQGRNRQQVARIGNQVVTRASRSVALIGGFIAILAVAVQACLRVLRRRRTMAPRSGVCQLAAEQGNKGEQKKNARTRHEQLSSE